MKKRWFFGLIICVALLTLIPTIVIADTFSFQRTEGIDIAILTPEEFQATFGDNPDIPLTHSEIVEYATWLFPPLESGLVASEVQSGSAVSGTEIPPKKGTPSPHGFTDNCGEYEFGVLMAALQNPEISDETRSAVDEIMAAAEPPLLRKWADGHFVVHFTSTNANPDQNITLAQAKTLAANLNIYWDKYVANFKTPKNVAGKVHVKVYYLGDDEYGFTGSGINFIALNSKAVAPDPCNRKTTPAHELFHRVQYAYGYESGTAGMKWMTEGTASYIQKFTNISVRDYMERMNEGLVVPWKPLMARDDYGYTTCHYWVYLAERSSWSSIKDVWSNYETNGKNAKAAVETVTTTRLGLTFDVFFRNWIKTNFIKDLNNAAAHLDYNEDESGTTPNVCGVTYGPLARSRRVVAPVVFTSTTPKWTRTENTEPYSADYYNFKLTTTDPKLKSLEITVDGAGALTTFVNMKAGESKKITDGTASKEIYTATFKPGDLDTIGVIVGGGSAAGNYTISAVPCSTLNISGVWDDVYGYVHDLTQTGTAVTGTVDTGACGVWNISGTYTTAPSKLVFTATNPSPGGYCAEWFTYTTTIAECDTFSGSWENSAGYTGAFTMTKRADPGVPPSSFKNGGNLWPTPARIK